MASSAVATLSAPPFEGRNGSATRTTLPALVVLVPFCLMIASFLFEMPPGRFRFQLPSIATALFMGCTALQPRWCYRWMPAALFAFLVFLYGFALSAALHGWVLQWEMQRRILFLLQAVVVFWAGLNLMSDRRICRAALWSFVVACVVRAALPYLGVGRTTYEERWTGGERVTAFGQDPNFSATLLSAGLVTLIWLTHRPSSPRWHRICAWPIAALLGIAILQTGSRGGLLALAVGLLACVFRHVNRPSARIRQLVIGTAALVALGVAAMNTAVMRGRMEVTEEAGSMAGREQLFPAAWQMFLERPFLGWGPQLNEYEVARRAPFLEHPYRDTHNLFLEVLTALGVIGAIPFAAGLGLCVVGAWRARRGELGILPLCLLGVFLAANLSIDMIANKPFWLALAVAVVGGRTGPTDA